MNIASQKYSVDLRRYYRLPAVQVSLTLALSLFVMAIFIVLALRPTIVTILTLRKTITESRKVLQQLDTKVANLQTASVQLENIKNFLPILNTAIPNKGAMYSPITTSLENLAISSGTTLESESLGPTLLFSKILTPFNANKNQKVIELPFTLRVTGSYPNISTFLTKFLSMERIIKVESIGITKEAGAKNTGTIVVLNISGNAFYLADEVQLEKALVETKGKK
jgi:Tfp pilus assembly protein PilO